MMSQGKRKAVEIYSECIFAIPLSMTFMSFINQEEYCISSASKGYILIYNVSITYLLEFSMSSHRATR